MQSQDLRMAFFLLTPWAFIFIWWFDQFSQGKCFSLMMSAAGAASPLQPAVGLWDIGSLSRAAHRLLLLNVRQ